MVLICFKALCQVNLLQWPVGNTGWNGLVVTCTKIRFFFKQMYVAADRNKIAKAKDDQNIGTCCIQWFQGWSLT